MSTKLIKYFEAKVFDDLTIVTFDFDEISYFAINKSRHVIDPIIIEYHDCIFHIYPLRTLNTQEREVLEKEWRSYCPA
ncbi:hypothetical protein CAT59_07355 [Acinetobacter pittii]|uniref:Uncharacterized protein n=1 Tax=Acinetobacter pittii TaxID=48296 RepID=A0A242U5N2_ACIPI|nr:hypothetical protein [Acinetobacter pittii]OTU28367.1 hypothetical protein CAT59_07355 [Acinetobacter pittii]